MIYIYRLSYLFFKIILQILSPFLSVKTKNWIRLRSNTNYLNQKIVSPLWFHASSGEIEYCKAVIKQLKAQNANLKIVLSYSSPSAEKLLFNIKDDVDYVFPLPWDTRQAIQKTLNHFKPRVIIFSRTDFWPELIHQAQFQKIPLMAISMFPKLNLVHRKMYLWLLKNFSLITTVDSKTSEELSILLHQQVYTFSDTRFDQVFNRLGQPSKIIFSDGASLNQRIIFASTWPEDEKVIFPALEKLISSGYKIIIAPHDTHRAQNLALKLKSHRPTLLSEYPSLTDINMKTPLLIVDRVGYLADIYRYTFCTFVGGSFKRKIHSVMEPLAAQNHVLFGPFFNNNPEAVETQQKGLTHLVRSTDDILKLLQPTNLVNATIDLEHIKEYTEKQRGSSRLIAEKILENLI